jgi:hypothetical protein
VNKDQITALARPKAIPSAPGYFVDVDGEVYNHRGRRMAQQVTHKGYCRVALQINGESKSKSVHSLVAEVFIGPRPKGLQIRHLDGNKTNNSPNNLSYGTAAQNEADKSLHGTKATGLRNGAHTKPERRPHGESHARAKLNNADVVYIKKQLQIGPRGIGKKLAEQFGVSISIISKINVGKIWRHL